MKTIKIPLFNGKVFIYRTKEELTKALQKAKCPEDLEGDYLGICVPHTSANRYYVGWFDDKVSTLIHELSHAVFFILRRAGVNPKDSNGEVFCYLLDNFITAVGLDQEEAKDGGKICVCEGKEDTAGGTGSLAPEEEA